MKDISLTSDNSPSHIVCFRRQLLFSYDIAVLLFTGILILGVGPSSEVKLSLGWFWIHFMTAAASVFLCRILGRVYNQVWRYFTASSYIRLILSDIAAGMLYYLTQRLPFFYSVEFIRVVTVSAINLLLSISLRLVYHYLYETYNRLQSPSGYLWKLVSIFSGYSITSDRKSEQTEKPDNRIKLAVLGAGRVGVMLAEELLKNRHSQYIPLFFVDVDRSKIGREILNLPVYSDKEAFDKLTEYGIQEIVFALPQLEPEIKKELYDKYKGTGCRIKNYDYPIMQNAGSGKRQMREFDIEELLFRAPVNIRNNQTNDYYRGKVILITGGGGSIGSELCRQIAQMQPKKLIILDIYENGVYDIQQELRAIYGSALDMRVEIASVCDREAFEKVFETYHPDVLLHAAAHKHVPLMEHNCCEAIRNNVFGTLNAVQLSEKYNVKRFIMISTDKAVNPTNVMGATKRMCEMIVLSHAGRHGNTVFNATRFGNVLGSAGSVIPLFKRQITNGGPVTITDKRIIRYFMTIPEASQLVLQSGVMAKNGELFVLEMGNPVRILELAENMIRLSGYKPYVDIEIVETGLRPGEKLYEELLIRNEELDKTENSMIFIERDEPLKESEIAEKLRDLREAVDTGDDSIAREALKRAVPTFVEPDVFNSVANSADTKPQPVYIKLK